MDIKDIDVVILCGGQGQRLRSVVSDVPKVMAPMDGRPFLDILIRHFSRQGAHRFILSTGYKAEMIEDYYRSRSLGFSVEFSRETEPLGTGGGLRQAQAFIHTDPFIVMNGDSLCPIELSGLVNFSEEKKGLASLAVAKVSDSKDFGGIMLDASQRILCFKEKQALSQEIYVNAGIYCLSQKVFSLFPEQKRFMFEYDCFPFWIDKGLYGYPVEEPLIDIGTPDRYIQAKQMLQIREPSE